MKKRTFVYTYKDKPYGVAGETELDLMEYISKKKEADANVKAVLDSILGNGERIGELERQVAELRAEIEVLKGEK